MKKYGIFSDHSDRGTNVPKIPGNGLYFYIYVSTHLKNAAGGAVLLLRVCPMSNRRPRLLAKNTAAPPSRLFAELRRRKNPRPIHISGGLSTGFYRTGPLHRPPRLHRPRRKEH